MNAKRSKPAICIRDPFMMKNWLKNILSEHFLLVDDESAAKVHIGWRLPNSAQYRVSDRPLVIFCFWDAYLDQETYRDQDLIFFFARDWIRIHEYFYAIESTEPDLCRERNHSRFMLMLMNLRRDHRDLALLEFLPYLDHSLWTYLERGRCLPDDPVTPEQSVSPWGFNHRKFIDSWYRDTSFSMVIESRAEDRLFVSEKIFKPLRHGHPFMVYGCPGILTYLRQQGFETFAHDLDESYDDIPNPHAPYASYPAGVGWDTLDRLRAIKNQLNRLYYEWCRDQRIFHSADTQRILEHNRNNFFDAAAIQRLVQQQIVRPLLEIVESV